MMNEMLDASDGRATNTSDDSRPSSDDVLPAGDDSRLSGAASSDATQSNESARAASEAQLEAQAQVNAARARRLRWIELGLVLFVAFAMPVFSSFYTWLVSGKLYKSIPGGASSVSLILYELSGLAVLFYVLFRRKQPIATLIQSFSWRDLAPAVGIFLVAMIAATLYQYVWMAVFSTRGALGQSPKLTAASGISVAVVLFLVVNAFFEELIARAWTISELEALTGKTWIAVACSVLMQASYHLYQGLASALATAVVFLIFSLYYVRARRLWPVVLAHMTVDFLALAASVAPHHPHK